MERATTCTRGRVPVYVAAGLVLLAALLGWNACGAACSDPPRIGTPLHPHDAAAVSAAPCPQAPSPPACPAPDSACSPCVHPTCPAAAPCPACAPCASAPACPPPPPCPPGASGGDGSDVPALAGAAALVLEDVSAVRAAATVHGRVGTIALTAGNAAMNLMIRNWAASIRRVHPPLPHLVVPLDTTGLEGLTSAAAPANVYRESTALQQFSAGGSNYGESVYAEMSAFKWRFALKLLEAGVPVLLADPDVVFLRNPVPYIATLPRCDVHMQVDVDFPSDGASVRAKNGWEYAGVRDFFCGGFAHLAPSADGIAHLKYFLGQVDAMRRDDAKLEEQTVWNRMLTSQFERVTPNVVDALMARECIVYQHKESRARVSVWPLNPAMFPNYPIAVKEKMPERILEPPFIVHFNWLYGIAAKIAAMEGQGMLFVRG